MADLPSLDPSMSFDQACAAVVAYLRTEIPLGFWSVTRYDGADQVHLEVLADDYGPAAGDHIPWSETFCQHSISGAIPQIVPDAPAEPVLARMPALAAVPVGAYVGIPITRIDGSVFGTVCGIDPEVQDAALTERAPLLHLLSMLLSAVLEADLIRNEAADRAARAELLAETDALTGLANRRGWERFLAMEEERHRRFGDPGCVLILDLDGLKTVNDRDGHRAGDDLLARAADALRSALRCSDLAARLGGDEFGVIAPRCTVGQATRLVDRVRTALAAADVESSVGLASYRHMNRPPGVWATADAAMYEDKRRRANGRQTSLA